MYPLNIVSMALLQAQSLLYNITLVKTIHFQQVIVRLVIGVSPEQGPPPLQMVQPGNLVHPESTV